MDSPLWLHNWAEIPSLLKLAGLFYQLQLSQDFMEI